MELFMAYTKRILLCSNAVITFDNEQMPSQLY